MILAVTNIFIGNAFSDLGTAYEPNLTSGGPISDKE
jgi:hypothetical protein